MRPRRHHRNGFWGLVFQHWGTWLPAVVIVLILIALALGGPSLRY